MKLIKAEEHVKFNEQCLQHNLFPIFTNIKLHDANAGSQPFVQKFHKELIFNEIKKHKEQISLLDNNINSKWNELKTMINSNIKEKAILNFFDRIENKTRVNIEINHNKNLCNLYQSHIPIKQTKNNVLT